MDDRRVGLVIRAIRRRRGWRQIGLASVSGLSQATVSTVERGNIDGLSFRSIRRILSALEARGELDIRWRGGALDRTIDERHARLVEAIVDEIRRYGWSAAVEVTYAVYGERGSIDVLAFHDATGSLLVIEVKTELTSIEETLRRHDQKVRLASRIAMDRSGWQARTTSRLLVLPESSTTRDQVNRHIRTFDAALPDDNVVVRRWLRNPVGILQGRLFFRIISGRSTTEGVGRPERVARPKHRPGEAGVRVTRKAPNGSRPAGGR